MVSNLPGKVDTNILDRDTILDIVVTEPWLDDRVSRFKDTYDNTTKLCKLL